MQGLAWTTLQLPLAAGLQQSTDDRARQPPYLDVALDVQFDEQGGVQTRKPFLAQGASIVGGGTISNARRLVANGDELLLFTDTALYSWNEQLSKWVSKGTHLAVKVDDEAAFVATGDQVDCDRAELSGVIVYVWTTTGGRPYIAALDKETGSVLVSPTQLTGSGGAAGDGTRTRVISLATVFHVYWIENTSDKLLCLALDPATLSTSTVAATPTTIDTGLNAYYDVVKVPGADTAIGAIRLTPTTSYMIFKVPANPASATTSTKARTCTNAIAVSCDPTGTNLEVIRANSTNVVGDMITISSLADTAQINKAIGTTDTNPATQIAACHRSVADGGNYRCYAFWSSTNGSIVGVGVKYNYVDTAGNLGTQAQMLTNAAVASRAFDYGGRVFVHIVFAGESASFASAAMNVFGALQNSYYLYRDDAFLVAKQLMNRAGGFIYRDSILPGVALTAGTTGYSWCGTERRVIPIGVKGKDYEDRGPRDVTITFDSNDARRCVRLGETLYITGGEILQYDGVSLVEVGFHTFPWFMTAGDDGTSGSIPDGTYAFKHTWRYDNAKGDRDRSTTAIAADAVANTGAPPQRLANASIASLSITHKRTDVEHYPALEVWRTAVNPTLDAPFYLVTSKDPADVSGANCYVANDPTAFTLSTFYDELLDADIVAFESDPETGGVLENLAPPPASVIIASDTRLFLAGVSGDPDRVWYSKLRSPGEVAAFHDALTVTIPSEGGDITALGFLNETLIVFRETAIYACAGDGFDNLGGGQNYGPARQLALGCGAVNHESVVATPGGLMFKSNKGWYLLNRGWSAEYIGGAISDYDDETPIAVTLVETQHQVRILTSSRMLVFDYLAQQWAEWTVDDGLHATVWQGTYAYLAATQAMIEVDFADATLDYGLDVETAWIKPADLQGGVSVRWIELLGEFMSTDWTHLRVRVAYNYNDTYVDDKYCPVTPVADTPFQLRYGPKRPKCEAIKFRFTAIRRHTTFIDDVETTVNDPPTGEALKLTGLGLEVGAKRGLYRRLSADQKA